MASLRAQFGFWAALGRLRLADLRTAEVVGGVVFGLGGGILLVLHAKRAVRIAVAGDYVQLSSALVGIVFAGFALVIGLLSDDYLRWLESTGSGVLAFLQPFMVSTGLQVAAVFSAVAYRAMAAEVSSKVEHWLFPLVSLLFTLALFDVVSLARLVLMHGVARARGQKLGNLGDDRPPR